MLNVAIVSIKIRLQHYFNSKYQRCAWTELEKEEDIRRRLQDAGKVARINVCTATFRAMP